MLFLHIDSFVIDKIFEPFSHWRQRLTGRNNFWQARQALVLSYIFSMLFFAAELKNVYLTLCIFFSGLFFYSLIFILMIKNEKLYLEKDYLQRAKNPLCINLLFAIFRLMILFLFIFFICLSLFIMAIISDYYILFILGTYLMFTVAIYLDSCTPLPPATSKVKEWLMALRRIFALAFNKS